MITVSLYGSNAIGGVNPAVVVQANTNQAYIISAPEVERVGSSKYEIEVEANASTIIITTKNTLSNGGSDLYRVQLNGSFSYNADGSVSSGSVSSIYSQHGLNGADINQSQRWSIKRLNLASPKDWNTLNTLGVVYGVDYTSADQIQTTLLYDQYFSGTQGNNWWQFNPFAPAVLGTASSSGNGSSTSSSSTWNTSTNVDQLTGVAKKKDIFQFSAGPGFGANADLITNFSAKDKDQIQLSKDAFGITAGRFSIAKKRKNLNKLLATDTSFIYNQQKGELIFNANGPEAGFGDDGGVFAQLVGAPKLTGISVSFI
jgi:hypothetical protein